MFNEIKFNFPSTWNDIWLIGFIIDPDNTEPKLFTLIFTGKTDRPLASESYIVFLNNIKLVPDLMNSIELESGQKTMIPEEIEYVINIPNLLYLISIGDIDESTTVVDSLNIIFDILKETRLSVPDKYKNQLYKFANYLTFDKDISKFFNEQKDISRKEVIDALLWFIGAIVSKSKLLTR